MAAATTARPASTTVAPSGAVEPRAGADSRLFEFAPRTGSTVVSGRQDAAASDGRALALTIPVGAQAGPGHAAEVKSRTAYRYGRFSSRVRTADLAATAP